MIQTVTFWSIGWWVNNKDKYRLNNIYNIKIRLIYVGLLLKLV